LPFATLVAVVMLLGLGLPKPAYITASSNGVETSTFIPAERTKQAGCVVNYNLPDSACTPGAVIDGVTREQLCTFGYSKTVRDVSAQTKQVVYAAYGIDHHAKGEFQVDHLISLELGGSNDDSNLWPQPALPAPGYREKDRFENYLHDQICTGKLKMADVQQEISLDWASAYRKAGL
jgi:hypothetical protein